MGNLAEDSAVTRVGDGRYRAELREDWNIWGPNGGYLAAVALRAAGAHSAQPRPVSLQCHFLGVAAFEPVDLHVTTLRASKRAEAVRVEMSQHGQAVLEALVWTRSDDLDGLAHTAAAAEMPDVPTWDTLTPIDELLPPGATRHRFADNLDERRVERFIAWEERQAGEPEYLGWFRFRPQPTFDDPYVDGGRLAILVDTFQWPAAVRGHDGATLAYAAPSLDLTCQFHQDASASDWLFVQAQSPVAADGLVAGTARIWDTAGRLVASGSQTMLCRPMRPTDHPPQAQTQAKAK